MRKFKLLTLIMLLVFLVSFAGSEQNVVIVGGQNQGHQRNMSSGDPISASTVSAQANTNKMMWFGAGCLFGLLGVGAAYLIEPTPPATSLIGKNSNYVAIYTENYKKVGKSIQGKQAIWGCVAESLLVSLYYVFVYVIFVEAVTDPYYYY
ncbi:hypothetical protein J7L48_02280 [bacterium]|nr:hypothetical protein [bacterium]